MRVFIKVAIVAVALNAIFVRVAYANTLSDLQSPFISAIESGRFGLALALIFFAGLATSLTPCVDPMIAITVSVFGAQQARTRVQVALLSAVFVLGIAALFTPPGLFVATTGGLFGSLLSSPFVLVGIALMVFGCIGSIGYLESLPPRVKIAWSEDYLYRCISISRNYASQ